MNDTNPVLDEADLISRLTSSIKPSKLPDWVEAETLPDLRWRDGRPAPIQNLVLACLKRLAVEGESELFSQLAKQLDPAIGADFAWALFERWNRAGGPPAHKWALYALGIWGDDTTARTLGRLVREWPTQKKFKRAEQGLEVLERLGTDVALAEIDAIASTTKSAALRIQAADRIRAAAKKRGLSPDELGDRLVPTFGMTLDGQFVLDFGPRQFHAQLEGDFTLTVTDDEGKIRKTAPKPAASDDPIKSTRAAELLKSARKDLKDQLTLQSGRLERAMVDNRTWSLADWRQYLLSHPLMRRLAQRVVWQAQMDGNLSTFRIAEDWTLADQEDRVLPLESIESLSIVHPLLLDDDTRDAWRTILEDYEIAQPFEQMTRQTFQATPEEAKSVPCERYVGYMVDGRQVLAQLARHGWRQGTPRAYGSIFLHSRGFPAARVTAVLHHGGVLVGYYEGAIESAVGPLMFLRGCPKKVEEVLESPSEWLPIADVPAIPFSEALRDADRLAKSGSGFDPDWRQKMGM